MKIELVEVDPENSFTDLTRFPLARMYGIHQMDETHDGIEVGHTLELKAPCPSCGKRSLLKRWPRIRRTSSENDRKGESLRSNV